MDKQIRGRGKSSRQINSRQMTCLEKSIRRSPGQRKSPREVHHRIVRTTVTLATPNSGLQFPSHLSYHRGLINYVGSFRCVPVRRMVAEGIKL